MKHTEFSMDMLEQRLQTAALENRTPRRLAGLLYEAAEIIRQLRREIAGLKRNDE